MGEREETDELALLGRAVADAGTVTAMTGAGVSTASGVPDFRGEDGLWQSYDRGDFHRDRFDRDPAGFWADWLSLRATELPADPEPNPAHESLADLVSAGAVDTLVTQNVDGLHAAAGTPAEDLIRLHGSTDAVVCTDDACRRRLAADPVRELAREGECPPTCPACGGPLKPGAVLFGEQLPRHAHLRAHAAAEKSDLFLVAGSSLTVEPAATLPETAADRGATLAVCNRDPTPLEGRASYTVRGDVGPALSRLRDEVLDG